MLRVIPYKSLCFQCFLDKLPDIAIDEEFSNVSQIERIQYSPDDPSVPIEPGLSTDIAPISLFVTKLAILELLKGQKTTFINLYDDLIADWYIWLNRREQGTAYEDLTPMAYEIDNMHIMRWYGVDVQKNTDCPVCGKFGEHINVTKDDIDSFR